MPENKHLLEAYDAVVDEIAEWKGAEKLAVGWKESPVYERLLAVLKSEPARFEGLKLSPSVLIELGLYQRGRAAAEAFQALRKIPGAG